MVVVAGVVGGAFNLALQAQAHHGWTPRTIPPTWVTIAYSAA
jgi:hypothetical protein